MRLVEQTQVTDRSHPSRVVAPENVSDGNITESDWYPSVAALVDASDVAFGSGNIYSTSNFYKLPYFSAPTFDTPDIDKVFSYDLNPGAQTGAWTAQRWWNVVPAKMFKFRIGEMSHVAKSAQEHMYFGWRCGDARFYVKITIRSFFEWWLSDSFLPKMIINLVYQENKTSTPVSISTYEFKDENLYIEPSPQFVNADIEIEMNEDRQLRISIRGQQLGSVFNFNNNQHLDSKLLFGDARTGIFFFKFVNPNLPYTGTGTIEYAQKQLLWEGLYYTVPWHMYDMYNTENKLPTYSHVMLKEIVLENGDTLASTTRPGIVELTDEIWVNLNIPPPPKAASIKAASVAAKSSQWKSLASGSTTVSSGGVSYLMTDPEAVTNVQTETTTTKWLNYNEGKVGIGLPDNTAPDTRLHVSGTITASNLAGDCISNTYSTLATNSTSTAASQKALNDVYQIADGKWEAVSASASVPGIVKFKDTYSESLWDTAASCAAVKAAYDLASRKWEAVSASDSVQGIVKFKDTYSDNLTDTAASCAAVKAAYDLASKKWEAVNASASVPGIVKFKDTYGESLTDTAASCAAVKAAYDLASRKWEAVNASASVPGIVKFKDTYSESLWDTAASCAAVKAAYDLASNKVSSQWTTGTSSIYYTGGSVGIGTALPSSALEVVGTIKASLEIRTPASNVVCSAAYVGGNYQNGMNVGANALVFFTNPTNGFFKFQNNTGTKVYMTILNGGNVGIGLTNPTTALEVSGTIKATEIITDGAAQVLGKSYLRDEVYLAMDKQPQAGVYGVTCTPNARFYAGIKADGNITAASYTTSSDEKLKNVIGPISNVLDTIANINGYKYTMKSDETKTVRFGVIAQEVQKTYPELVRDMDLDGYLNVDYMGLVPVLLEAIKELKSQINTLRDDVEFFKSSTSEASRQKRRRAN